MSRVNRHQISASFLKKQNENEKKGIESRFARSRSTGILDLTDSNIDGMVSHELMQGCGTGAIEQNESWWNVALVKEARFSHNKIVGIENGVFQPFEDSMEVLLLDHNCLASFPLEINTLPQLRKLVMTGNKIREIPNSFPECMQMMAVCIFAKNSIMACPRRLDTMFQLKVLDLSENALVTFDSILPSGLEQLNLSKNQIESFDPEVFHDAHSLQTLDLANNRLFALPSSLYRVQSLKQLDLRYNGLEIGAKLPENLDQALLGFNRIRSLAEFDLGRLRKMTVLDVRDNQIEDIPEDLFYCKALKLLELSNNNLSNLPVFLGYLENLNGMSVTGNPLRSFRQAVLTSGCEKLKAYLRTRGPAPMISGGGLGNHESDQPQSVEQDVLVRDALAELRHSGILKMSPCGHLGDSDLESVFDIVLNDSVPCIELDISAMRFSRIPFGALSMGHLTRLTCANNFLPSLDFAVLSGLQNLRHLDLTNNQIETITSSRRTMLPNLEVLSVRQNKLAVISPYIPDACPHLHELHAGFNHIEYDTENLMHLKFLQLLDLSNNKLKEIPMAVWSMAYLAHLNLENNNITSIPHEIAQLPSLKILLISGNPQRAIRAHIVAEGSSKLLEYLRARCIQEPAPAKPPPAEEVEQRKSQYEENPGPRYTMSDLKRVQDSVRDLEYRLENDISMSTTKKVQFKRQLQRDRALLIEIKQHLS